MSDLDSVTQSYTEEILSQEMQLKRQTSLERTVNINTLRLNAILCIVLLSIVTYFIIGQNYILNWMPNNPEHPNRVFELGIKSFRADGFATFYVCLDFNHNCKVSERELCRNIDLAFAIDFKNECEELRRFYPVGIIVCIFALLIHSLIVHCLLSMWDYSKYNNINISVLFIK